MDRRRTERRSSARRDAPADSAQSVWRLPWPGAEQGDRASSPQPWPAQARRCELASTARERHELSNRSDSGVGTDSSSHRRRLWRSVKYEEVYLRAYESVSDARASIGDAHTRALTA
jgi:hypothetical protein